MLVIVLIVWLLGGDPMSLLSQMSQQSGSTPGSSIETRLPRTPAEDEAAKFVSVVLADTEEVWHDVFKQLGGTYKEPKLYLFTEQVRSGCGAASAEMGPFYCPADQNVYIDLSGWSPKYFEPKLVQYANNMLKHKVLFGSDNPVLLPDRWIAEFDKLAIKPEARPLILKENAARLLKLK